ncbi:hypothetical protein EDF51_11129 [Curtobacterium sp. PhB25]|uniref:hypothetical protein n=1 Tax=Curtobacterium sp. PhB25 TaxID=2485205 RepID=UPI0010647077|nr:hypothetical protein [Curtobacterium sp. PhB25]TDW64759.1 hypothetical protein EDF51_11129 [Curtobacterium sp. PhB25]
MARKKPDAGIRSTLVNGLRPLLPRGWKLHPYRTVPDDINQTTVWVKLDTIDKLPEAPQSGANLVTFVVTVASTKVLLQEADADLDDRVIELMHALDALPLVRRASARQVAATDVHLGFDISVEVLTYPIPDKE